MRRINLPEGYDTEGPAFSWRRMDEGPVLNKIGYLCVFLHQLGLKAPIEVFSNNVAKPKWFKKTGKQP